MAYYRVRTGNRESIVEYDQPMSFVGEIYKDRLVGECDEYGNLRDVYISPELEAALAKAGEEFIRLYPEYANSAQRAEEFTKMLEPQKVLHPEECGITQVLPYIAVMKEVHGRVAKPLPATHTLKELLECLPSSQVRWSDIKPLPEFYPGLKRDLTVVGDVVETPITVEEPVVTKLSPIETILARAVNSVPMRHLTDFGATEAVKYLFDKVGPQGFNGLNYSKWIMDHGNSNTYDLLEALQTTTLIPIEKAYPLSDAEHARLVAYIGKINSTMIANGFDPHFVTPPEVWQSQNVFTPGYKSAFEIAQEQNPGLTYDEWTESMRSPKVAMDPNDPNPLNLTFDPEQVLKDLRGSLLVALDDFQAKVNKSYGWFDHLGEARIRLIDKQFKHARKYVKQLVNRLTAPGDNADMVFLDGTATDELGFLFRSQNDSDWKRHFAVKFVNDNWIVVEH